MWLISLAIISRQRTSTVHGWQIALSFIATQRCCMRGLIAVLVPRYILIALDGHGACALCQLIVVQGARIHGDQSASLQRWLRMNNTRLIVNRVHASVKLPMCIVPPQISRACEEYQSKVKLGATATALIITFIHQNTEALMLNKSDLSSLDFVITRLFMKLFRTNNTETVEFCQDQLGFDKPSVLWARRVRNFDSKFVASENAFCIVLIVNFLTRNFVLSSIRFISCFCIIS